MAKEAGFNVTIRPIGVRLGAERRTTPASCPPFLVGWSGRVDPDANIHQFHTCKGSLNTTQACDEAVDSLLNQAREVSDQKERADLYRQAIDRIAARRNQSCTSTT